MSLNKLREYEIGDFADILSGYAFKSKEFIEKGIPVIKIKNIVPPIIDIKDVQYVSDELYNEKIRYALDFNDILISLTGSNVNQIASAVGKIGRVRLKNKKLLLNQRVGKLYITDKDTCDHNYLYYYLIQEEIRYNLAASAGGSANQANISPAQIKKIKIKLPILEEQKSIVNILLNIDEKIETNNQINKKLEEMAQAIFKQWFVDFEFPNEDGEPYKFSDGEMIESEMGMIPKGWEVSKLEDIVCFNPKENLNKENEYKYVEMAALDNNTSKIKYWQRRKLSGGSKFRNGDTLLARITPCLENGKTAYVDILEENEVAFGSTEFIVMREMRVSNNIYIYCLARENNFRAHAIKSMSGSSGRQRVQLDLLKNYPLVQAPKYIYDSFGKIGESLFEKISSNNQETARLIQLRDNLLPKLMSGEIRVPINN